MDLTELLDLNEELTGALLAALDGGDEAACAGLLARRGDALAALDLALRGAGSPARERWQGRLVALAEADRRLQLAATTSLAQAGEAFRSHLGSPGRATTPAERSATPVCLDRRA